LDGEDGSSGRALEPDGGRNLGPLEGVLIPLTGYLASFAVAIASVHVVSLRTQTALSSAALLAVAYVLLYGVVGNPWRCVGFHSGGPRVLVYAVLASLAIIIPAMSLQAAAVTYLGLPKEWMEEIWPLVRAENVPQLIYAWLVLALGTPLSEEFVFRGILQNGLAARLRGWLAVLIATAVFAALHGWRFPAASALGAFLGALYLRTGTIVPSIAAHLTINSVAIFTQFAIEKGGQDLLPVWFWEEGAPPLALIAVSLVAFGGLMAVIWRETGPWTPKRSDRDGARAPTSYL
jgi:membrane protease YdiL (CAAX protease family)